jgi:hypothetical protein
MVEPANPVLDQAVLDELEFHYGIAQIGIFADMFRVQGAKLLEVLDAAENARTVAGALGLMELMARCREVMIAERQQPAAVAGLAPGLREAAARALSVMAARFPAPQ